MITVACIIPCFNMADTLERAIVSAIEAKMDKIVVVDDCSEDNAVDIIEKYANIVTYWRWPTKSIDWIDSLEVVYKQTDADYFVGLGADDALKPELATHIKNHSQSPIIFTDYSVVDTDYNYLFSVSQDVGEPTYFSGSDMRIRIQKRPICTESGVASAIRKDIILYLYRSNFQILGPHADSVGYATASCFYGCCMVPVLGGAYTRTPKSYGYDPDLSIEKKIIMYNTCNKWMTSVGLDNTTKNAILAKRCS